MPDYSDADLRRVNTYGRVEMFQVGFDGRVPTCSEIISSTFEQMLVLSCKEVIFRAAGGYYALSAREKWITLSSLVRMANGVIMSIPEMGDNSTRIESFYRYLYSDIAYIEHGNVNILSGKLDLDYERITPRNKSYCSLILGRYGQYNWNEKRTYF